MIFMLQLEKRIKGEYPSCILFLVILGIFLVILLLLLLWLYLRFIVFP